MSDWITATVYVDVTVRVPIKASIDPEEFADWTEEPLNDETAQRFIEADPDPHDSWLRGAPAANAIEHEVIDWDVAHVELGEVPDGSA